MNKLIHAVMAIALLVFAVVMFQRVSEPCMQQLLQLSLDDCSFEDAGIPIVAAFLDIILWVVLIYSLFNRRARA